MADLYMKRRKLNITLMSLVVLLFVCSTNAFAVNYTLNGTWSNPANWSGGNIPSPVSGDKIIIGANSIIDVDVTIPADVEFEITFGSPAVAFTLNPGKTLTINGRWINFSGGSVEINGTLVVNTAAPLVFQNNNGSTLNINATGTLNQNGASSFYGGSINNSGTINIPAGAIFNYSANTGNPTTQFINTGTIKGEGTIQANRHVLNNAGGVIAPGSSPGCLNIEFLNNTGTLEFEVDGTTACTGYDKITSTGTGVGPVVLGGILDVTVNYTPSHGDIITLIDATSFTGTFASDNLPSGWVLKYNFPNTGEVSIENTTPPPFNVDFNASAICADATEWLVPIDVGAVPSDIGAISLVLDYDNTKLTYSAVQSVHANLTNAALDNSQNLQVSDNNGKITISWINSPAVTIANSTLMTLKFVPANSATDFSAIAGQTTDFTWDTGNGNNQIADGMASPMNATFNAQTGATVNATPTADLTSDATNNTTLCAGDNVTFTATGGTSYSYDVNGGTPVAGTGTGNAQFSSSSLANGDVVRVTVTDANGCSSTASLTMVVNPLPTAGLTSDATNNTTLCAGDNVTFTATGGTSYSFDVNGGTPVAGAGAGGDEFQSSTLANGDVVRVTVTDGNGCSSTASLTMVVNPLPTVGISSDDVDNTICAGDNVTFTGSGATSYTFQVNGGTPVAGTGAGSDEFSSNSLADGDVVTVTGTDANGCSNTASITMTVNPLPTVGFSSDKTNDEICAGETITFTATGAGAGAAGTGSGNALNFLGSSNPNPDRVTGTNASLPQGAGVRTIEAWIKTDPGSSGDESIFEWGTKANNQRSGLFIRSTGELVHISEGTDLDGTTNIRTGAWIHVAATYDGTTTKVYVNGVLDGSKTQTLATNGTGFSMGSAVNNTEFFDGTIDEVRVWNIARSAADIQSTMNTSLSGSEAGLVAYFDFNQGGAAGFNGHIPSLTDATGNGNGTFSGFAMSGVISNFIASTNGVTPGAGGTYEFFLNGSSVQGPGADDTYDSNSLSNGDKVKVKVVNANGCVAESSEITVTVNALPTTTLTSDDTDSRICQGQSVTFTASSSDGANEFIFMSSIDGVVQAQSATTTYTDNGLQDSEVISVIGVNTTTGCQQASATTFTMDVDGCHSVSGNLVYKNSAETPMGNVVITVSGPGLAANTTVTTDVGDGSFTVDNLFDSETYTFSYATTKTHGGINSTDALLALLDAVNILNQTGINAKAADVDINAVVAADDALDIQLRFVFANVTTFPGGEDWVFDAGSFTPTGDITGQKLYSLAMGDINGSYIPNSAENKLPTVNIVNDGQIVANDGDRILIPVRIKQTEDVGAMSLAMFFPSNAMTIHDVTLADGTTMLHNSAGDELRVAWANNNSQIFATDDVLYYVDATIHDVAAYNAAPFSLTSESELADGMGAVLTQVVLGVPTIQAMVTSTNAIDAAAASVRSFPNPFTDRMTIEYDLPSTSQVTIQMFNSLGQEVATLVNDTQGEGTHRAIWNAGNQSSGVYYYTITVTEGGVSYKQTKQVVLMK
jgi:hypothetical protein